MSVWRNLKYIHGLFISMCVNEHRNQQKQLYEAKVKDLETFHNRSPIIAGK